MSYKLKPTLQAIAIVAVLGSGLSGCATVNLAEVTTPSQYKTASAAELNVVQRAAASLNMVFRDRGFVAKTSRKRLQSAASVLLNGLEDKQIIDTKPEELGYAATPKPISVVTSDISYARSYIDRTVAAAEIYLEIAPAKRDLREELSSLEKALLASTEAHEVFEASLKGQTRSEMIIFDQSVAKLRAITDEFGVRVRVQDTEKLASRGFNAGS